ncbi:MAG: Fic family protein [Armatimonadota bacterium]
MAIQESSNRSGVFVNQLTGDLRYRAFVPKPLPPEPPVSMDMELWQLLSDADRALGRLDGIAETLPNPELFVAMYVRKEAVLSSQIEGTQASLVDLLEFETEQAKKGLPQDLDEVVNYVSAMDYGLKRLDDLPVSLRLIKEIHSKLLHGVRGGERSPGEFRTTQNWVGPPGSTLANATFIPPPPHEMMNALGQMEVYIHADAPIPVLVKIGLVHAQFETIHPFLDGNGRIGRLLVTLMLCNRAILRKPLLYLSYYFKQNRTEYYDRLTAVRTRGDWEGWLKFFVKGVYDVSLQATSTARAIIALRDGHRELVQNSISGAANGLILLDRLYDNPIVSVKAAQELVGVSKVAANRLVSQFVREGLLHQISPGSRNRIFAYSSYLDLFLDEETRSRP